VAVDWVYPADTTGMKALLYGPIWTQRTALEQSETNGIQEASGSKPLLPTTKDQLW